MILARRILNGEWSQSWFCLGYVKGLSAGYAIAKGPEICVSEGTAPETLIRLYVQYMEKNPKLLDENLAYGVALALRENYPCHKTEQK